MIDRKKIEELVRGALREVAGDEGAARRLDSGDAAVIPPDRGVNLGAPYDASVLESLLQSTPARIGVGRTGSRYRTNTILRFRADHAAAKDAVMSEVDPKLL